MTVLSQRDCSGFPRLCICAPSRSCGGDRDRIENAVSSRLSARDAANAFFPAENPPEKAPGNPFDAQVYPVISYCQIKRHDFVRNICDFSDMIRLTAHGGAHKQPLTLGTP
ncbi:hypothetical protein [Thalassovita mangrovi]|uniref:hypothetical protein n=1 Tax=Thalassovita mangrovi TaxID=2692236 RepID=UPI00136F138F|nr:hypothetical protein [Thalassovita mangrovi]